MADVKVHKFYNTRYVSETDLQIDIGTSLLRISRGYFLNLSAGGIDYTWPTSQTANFFLKVSSGTLSWADPSPSFVTINKWSTDN